MIINAQHHAVNNLLTLEQRSYTIPRYQREYSWQMPQWEKLFDDLIENPDGHFLGSIICIAIEGQDNYEVIDGQQRLTTLSILISSLYKKTYDLMVSMLPTDDNYIDVIGLFTSLKSLLFFDQSSSQGGLKKRLLLQNQQPSQNDNDYSFLLSSIVGNDGGQLVSPRNFGNRRIARAYRFFQRKIQDELSGRIDVFSCLTEIFKKLKNAVVVKIDVANHTNAFLLFESINNSGLPLTPMDLIKNKIMSVAADNGERDVDFVIGAWDSLMRLLGDSAAEQERYFRHFFNANKTRLNNDFGTNFSKAEKNNVINIYYSFSEIDPVLLMKSLVYGADFYSNLIGTNNTEPSMEFLDLARAQGTPGYILLLNLHLNMNRYGIDGDFIRLISNRLAKFFIRRNLTNIPSTRNAVEIFMRIIRNIELLNNPEEILDRVFYVLSGEAASDQQLIEALNGDIYADNAKATRFILYKIASRNFTEENYVDLWRMHNGRSVFSIEHILPQSDNIPTSWIASLENYVEEDESVNDLHQRVVHKLGNLTLTAYNSHLGNSSFVEKRDRVDSRGRYIGYKNGLLINADLVDKDHWTPSNIEERTKELTDLAVEILSLEE